MVTVRWPALPYAAPGPSPAIVAEIWAKLILVWLSALNKRLAQLCGWPEWSVEIRWTKRRFAEVSKQGLRSKTSWLLCFSQLKKIGMFSEKMADGCVATETFSLTRKDLRSFAEQCLSGRRRQTCLCLLGGFFWGEIFGSRSATSADSTFDKKRRLGGNTGSVSLVLFSQAYCIRQLNHRNGISDQLEKCRMYQTLACSSSPSPRVQLTPTSVMFVKFYWTVWVCLHVALSPMSDSTLHFTFQTTPIKQLYHPLKWGGMRHMDQGENPVRCGPATSSFWQQKPRWYHLSASSLARHESQICIQQTYQSYPIHSSFSQISSNDKFPFFAFQFGDFYLWPLNVTDKDEGLLYLVWCMGMRGESVFWSRGGRGWPIVSGPASYVAQMVQVDNAPTTIT